MCVCVCVCICIYSGKTDLEFSNALNIFLVG